MRKIRADKIDQDMVVQFAGLTLVKADGGEKFTAGNGTVKSYHPIDRVTEVLENELAVRILTTKHGEVLLAPNTKVLLISE